MFFHSIFIMFKLPNDSDEFLQIVIKFISAPNFVCHCWMFFWCKASTFWLQLQFWAFSHLDHVFNWQRFRKMALLKSILNRFSHMRYQIEAENLLYKMHLCSLCLLECKGSKSAAKLPTLAKIENTFCRSVDCVLHCRLVTSWVEFVLKREHANLQTFSLWTSAFGPDSPTEYALSTQNK